MTIYMGTTSIAADRTAGEIASLLAKAGASAILQEYKDGEVTSLSFTIAINGRDVPFRLPVRIDPVHDRIQSDRHHRGRRDYEQAWRIAWRQLLRWIQAQLAMLDVGMVDVAEIFLPYLQTSTGRTLYQQIITTPGNINHLIEWHPDTKNL